MSYLSDRMDLPHEKEVGFDGSDNQPATGSAKAVSCYPRKTNGFEDDRVLGPHRRVAVEWLLRFVGVPASKFWDVGPEFDEDDAPCHPRGVLTATGLNTIGRAL